MEKLIRVEHINKYFGSFKAIDDISFELDGGKIYGIIGPNGAGKSTLSNVILANPEYVQTDGEIILDGENINSLKTDERARKGIFMSFQSPKEIPGVSVTNFLKYAKIATTGKPVKIFEFKKELEKNMEELKMKPEYANRNLNVGFSGGEKKKNEILQMLTLKPKLAILDETDSGLDVDAIKTVAKGIKMYSNKDNGVLIITHGTKILQGLHVDYVHVLVDGKIIKTSTGNLANEIEENGYEEYKK
jgi:Fe-S cluster assembly ATP-binding protein